MVYDIPAKYAGGTFFIGWRGRNFGENDVDDYFAILDLVRPLLAQADFNACTIGFYINRIGEVPDDVHLRLNYYSVNVPETIRIVEQFVNASADLAVHKGEHGNRDKPISGYNDGSLASELAFKNFLDANTRVCLEVLQNFGRNNTRTLVQNYILNDMLQQEKRPETVLDAPFTQHSSTYRDLIQRGFSRRHWDDSLAWFTPDSPGIHLMNNMLVVAEPNWGLPAFRALLQRVLAKV